MTRIVMSDDALSESAAGASAEELRAATVSGIRWISVARAAAELTAFASSLALARLIPPAEFGRAVIALVPVWLALAINMNGLGASLVRLREINRAHLEAAAFVSLFAGATLTLASALLAPALAGPLFGERTAYLLQLTSPAWTLAALGAVGQAMLQRRLDFRRIGLIEVAALLAGSATAVTLATVGLDGEALAVGAVVTVATDGILYLALGFVVRPRWNAAASRELASFGLPVAGSSLVYTVFRNVDYALLGIRMSAAQVGFYSRAFQLGVDYQSKISTIMLRVAYPIYSRSAGAADIRALRTRIVRMHATILIPLLGGLIVLAPVVVPFLFGPRWEPAVFPTQILALAGIASALTTGRGPILLALGRAKTLLAMNVAELVVYAAMILVLAPHGLVAVAVGVVAFSFAVLVATQCVLRATIGIPVREVFDEAGPAVVSTFAMLAIVVPVTRVLDGVAVSAVPLLLAAGGLGVVTYLGILRVAFPGTWSEIRLLRRGLVPTRRRGGEPRLAREAAAPGASHP